MTFDEYQAGAKRTAIYPSDARVIYPALGLAGETGEFCDKLLQAIFPSDEYGRAEELSSPALKEARDILQTMALWGRRAEILKKVLRGKENWAMPCSDEDRAEFKRRIDSVTTEAWEAMKMELSDTYWYEAQLATDTGNRMADIAEANLDKLAGRQARGTLHGSGDNR